MKVKESRIFICYARKDIAAVNTLYENLLEAGLSPWQDNRNLLPGQIWLDGIIEAIRKSSFFLACLSPNSVNRRGVIQRELKTALDVWQEKLVDDIYLIPVLLDKCSVPRNLAQFQYANLLEPDGFNKLFEAISVGLKSLGVITPMRLRSVPKPCLSTNEATDMIKSSGFFDSQKSWMATGIEHLFEKQKKRCDTLVFDHTTLLLWQQSGSIDIMSYDDALKYVNDLNASMYCGFSDWRLPTLEEAMSLVEAKKQKTGVQLSTVFESKQTRIWTSDRAGERYAWAVHYKNGRCRRCDLRKRYDYFAKAVR